MKTYGEEFVIGFGPAQWQPIVNIPDGARIKVKLRIHRAAQVFVRTSAGCSRNFIHVGRDGLWRLVPVGVNAYSIATRKPVSFELLEPLYGHQRAEPRELSAGMGYREGLP